MLGLCAFVGGYLGTAAHRRGTSRDSATGAGRPKLLDTSALIDGRVADIYQAGFLEGPLLVPEVVLTELRRLADAPDGLKRQRGKRGLQALERLQATGRPGVTVVEEAAPGLDVDAQIVQVATRRGAALITTDHPLERVATVQGVQVLNVNGLALLLRAPVLSGEALHVQILKEGKEAGQGVGYLDDGTMVVVEDGRRYLGRSVEVTVTRVLQTSSGRLIFSRPSPGQRGETAVRA